MDPVRWLVDGPGDGVANMARDEALLERVGRRQSPPTLRFYRWSPPTVSLGYFQRYAEFESLPPPAGGLAVVRRMTGGGAILHDLELTYSLALPSGHPMLGGGSPNSLYGWVHSSVAGLLAKQGVPVARGPRCADGSSHRGAFFCFERHSCFDLLADGRKLMGSAQRRTATAVLQHGSLILDSRFDQQRCATVAAYTQIALEGFLSELARAIAGRAAAGALHGRAQSRDTSHGERPRGLKPAAHGCSGIAHGHIDLTPGAWEPEELDLADRLCSKYTDPAWTRRR